MDELFESAFENGCCDYLAKAFLKAGARPSPGMAHDRYSSNGLTLLLAPFIPFDEGCSHGLKEAIDEFYDEYPREGNQGYDCAVFDKLLKHSDAWFEELAAMTVSDMAALEQLYHTVLPTDILVHCIAPFLALVGGKSKQPRNREERTALPTDILVHFIAPYLAMVGERKSKQEDDSGTRTEPRV